MIDHIDIATVDLPRATRFYKSLLGTLGYSLSDTQSNSSGFRGDTGKDFWLTAKPAIELAHFAFRAKDRSVVAVAYETALQNGAKSRLSPRLMPQVHANYFAAQVYDPDGYLIEFACHDAE